MRCLRLFFLVVALMFLANQQAFAERILFSRANVLYVARDDGFNERRLFAMGKTGEEIYWAVSPDAKQLAIGRRAEGKLNDEGDLPGDDLASRPLIVTLCNLGGKEEKQLFATDALKDRLGNPVTTLANGKSLTDYTPRTLVWSDDLRTLYLGLSTGEKAGGVTLAIDITTGSPIVDGEGRAKILAPFLVTDVYKTRLVGTDTSLRLLDLTGAASYKPVSLSGGIGTACSTSDGKYLIGTGSTGSVWMAEADGTKARKRLAFPAKQVQVSRDGKRLLVLSSGEENGLYTFDVSWVLSLAQPATVKPGKPLLTHLDTFVLIRDGTR